jgi:ribosomal protein S13
VVRIAGIDLPTTKRIEYALTKLYGIGVMSARNILEKASIDFDLRTNELSDENVSKIREILESEYIVESDLKRQISLSIKRLGEIYENKKFDSVEDKKYNILNGLNKYLSKIIDEKIIFLVENQDSNFITTINNSVLKTCNEIYKKKEIEEKYNIKKSTGDSENLNDKLNDTLNKKINEKLNNTENIIKEGIKEEIKKNINSSTIDNNIPESNLKEFEKKIDEVSSKLVATYYRKYSDKKIKTLKKSCYTIYISNNVQDDITCDVIYIVGRIYLTIKFE